MQIKIKRFDTDLPLPEYKTAGAAAFDVYARLTVSIEPHTVGYVPLNVALEIPVDHFVLVSPRSSLHKQGVMMANGIGIGDSDFCGDGDEYVAPLLNFTNQPVVIERGSRVAQMIVLPREAVQIEEVAKLVGRNRGGFGTTGK